MGGGFLSRRLNGWLCVHLDNRAGTLPTVTDKQTMRQSSIVTPILQQERMSVVRQALKRLIFLFTLRKVTN
uniref:hypothetical protein n=1 Tax=Vibrio cholerae TaxID=666 RepID=UPI003F58AE7D